MPWEVQLADNALWWVHLVAAGMVGGVVVLVVGWFVKRVRWGGDE